MTHLRIWRSLLLALSAIGIGACATDSPTGPKFQGQASPGLVTDLYDGLVTKSVLQRTTPLARDVTVSVVIGKDGGALSIPEAGFRLFVPAGAVSADTRFTVTALKGSLVAYEFGPHGISFGNALSARQDLSVTQWRPQLRPLVAGYFAEKSALDASSATALLSELIDGSINPLSKHFSFRIEHFSGYVVAW